MSGAKIVAVFLGGPLDGQVHHVAALHSVVEVPVLDSDVSRYVHDRREPPLVRTRRVTYYRHDVTLFGRHLTTFIVSGVDREDRDTLVRDAFLTPLAKGLTSA